MRVPWDTMDDKVSRRAYELALARIAELEAAIRAMHAAVPGGATCDPQRVADDLRRIADAAGVQIDD